MISADEVKKLARLSRLSLTDAEVGKLQKDLDSILAYVDTIRSIPLPPTPSGSTYLETENVMREDANPHEPGAFTEELLRQAPNRDGNYVKVKKILP